MLQPGWEWEEVSPDIPDSGDMEQRSVSVGTWSREVFQWGYGVERCFISSWYCQEHQRAQLCVLSLCSLVVANLPWFRRQLPNKKISEIELFILMEEENHSWIFQVIHGLNKINGFYGFINNKNAIRWQPCHTSLLCLWQPYVSHLQTHWPDTFVPSKTTGAHPSCSEGPSKTSLLQQ